MADKGVDAGGIEKKFRVASNELRAGTTPVLRTYLSLPLRHK